MQVGTCYSSSPWGRACSGLALSVGAAAPLLGPLAGMCVPAGGVVGMECGRGARDTVLSTPYASPSRQLVLIFLPGLASVHYTCTYSVHAARRSGLAARPHGRASPWRGGACKTKTGVVGVPTQGVQSGQLVVSYLLNMRPTTTTSVRWRGGLSVSPLRRKDGGAIGKSFTLGCMVSPP